MVFFRSVSLLSKLRSRVIFIGQQSNNISNSIRWLQVQTSSDLAFEQVEVEYIPEKAELDGVLEEEFRKVFEKFNFSELVGSEENEKNDETATDTSTKKKADSNEEDKYEEQDVMPKEKGGISTKKKKLQRRMKIAELKQICSRPDVVEGKRGIEKQPF